LDPSVREPLVSHPGLRVADLGDLSALTPLGRQARVSAGLAVNVARLADESAAVHLLDYRYDRDTDGVPVVDDVEVSVRLPFQPGAATLISPGDRDGNVTLPVEFDGDAASVRLPSFRLYGVVVFEDRER
jgi:hypothetical protein